MPARAALRDLSRRPRLPGGGRRRRGAAAARPASRSSFPRRQVCCGQPAFNSGHRGGGAAGRADVRAAFSRELPVVVPSGSCATMASHYLPELLGVEPFEVWELSAFLVARGLPAAAAERGPPDRLPRLLPHAARAAHRGRSRAGCSSAPARSSSRSPRPDLCCGFGGTFSVRQPEVSLAMADDKLAGAATARRARHRRSRAV